MNEDFFGLEAKAPTESLRTLASLVLDRWQFMRQAGLTFGDKRNMWSVLGYKDQLTIADYRQRYERGGIAKRIVEAMPHATWRGGVELVEEIEDRDPRATKATKFEKEWQKLAKRLKLVGVFRKADILAGLSRYSVIVLGDGKPLDQELSKANGDSGRLAWVQAYMGSGGVAAPNSASVSTQSSTGDANASVYVDKIETDPQSERFGLPTVYRLKQNATTPGAPAGGADIHWSRVIHVCENALDDEVYGTPALEAVWNYLDDLDKVVGGGAEAFWLRANQGLNLNLDKDVKLDAAAVAALKAEVEEYKHNIGARILKTRGMDVKTLGSDVANFANQMDAIVTLIAGTKSIPKRILTGSEMGELASSQDRDNWRDQVNGRQEAYAGPVFLEQLANRLIDYGFLPEPSSKDGYKVKWAHAQTMTEQERADGAKSWAAVNQAQGETVFTSDEIREKWADKEPLAPELRKPTGQAGAAAIKADAGTPADAALGAELDPNAAKDPRVTAAEAAVREELEATLVRALEDNAMGVLEALLSDGEAA